MDALLFHLLYLATRAGAEALGLEGEAGDFGPGKSADFVYLRPPEGTSSGRDILAHAEASGTDPGGALHDGRAWKACDSSRGEAIVYPALGRGGGSGRGG